MLIYENIYTRGQPNFGFLHGMATVCMYSGVWSIVLDAGTRATSNRLAHMTFSLPASGHSVLRVAICHRNPKNLGFYGNTLYATLDSVLCSLVWKLECSVVPSEGMLVLWTTADSGANDTSFIPEADYSAICSLTRCLHYLARPSNPRFLVSSPSQWLDLANGWSSQNMSLGLVHT